MEFGSVFLTTKNEMVAGTVVAAGWAKVLLHLLARRDHNVNNTHLLLHCFVNFACIVLADAIAYVRGAVTNGVWLLTSAAAIRGRTTEPILRRPSGTAEHSRVSETRIMGSGVSSHLS
jgi:hypothetical protein